MPVRNQVESRVQPRSVSGPGDGLRIEIGQRHDVLGSVGAPEAERDVIAVKIRRDVVVLFGYPLGHLPPETLQGGVSDVRLDGVDVLAERPVVDCQKPISRVDVLRSDVISDVLGKVGDKDEEIARRAVVRRKSDRRLYEDLEFVERSPVIQNDSALDWVQAEVPVLPRVTELYQGIEQLLIRVGGDELVAVGPHAGLDVEFEPFVLDRRERFALEGFLQQIVEQGCAIFGSAGPGGMLGGSETGLSGE